MCLGSIVLNSNLYKTELIFTHISSGEGRGSGVRRFDTVYTRPKFFFISTCICVIMTIMTNKFFLPSTKPVPPLQPLIF